MAKAKTQQMELSRQDIQDLVEAIDFRIQRTSGLANFKRYNTQITRLSNRLKQKAVEFLYSSTPSCGEVVEASFIEASDMNKIGAQ